MGLGKTFIGAEKAIQLKKKILLICQKSKIEDWRNHFKEYYNIPVYDLTKLPTLREFVNNDGQCVAIINYDLTFRRQELSTLTDFTLVLDESSLIANPQAKRTKFILKLKCQNCVLLSGTPTGGKYEKIWTQAKLLGWRISKKSFYEQYITTKLIYSASGFKAPIVTGYKNVDELKSKLRDYGAIFMKTEEVFKLPEKKIIALNIRNTKYFAKFMRDGILSFNDRGNSIELIGDMTLTKRLYARQLCGQYNENKLKAVKDLIDSTGDRLIIFYNFTEELERLKKLTDKPISIINGSSKDLTKYEAYEDSICFVQYQAGSKGLNLQKANKIIYFTLPQSAEDFEQSKKRIHRIGQDQTCFYYIPLVENSIEWDIYENLKMRRDYDNRLFEKYEGSFKQCQ